MSALCMCLEISWRKEIRGVWALSGLAYFEVPKALLREISLADCFVFFSFSLFLCCVTVELLALIESRQIQQTLHRCF